MPEVSFFNKVTDLRPATLLKNRLWHRCFPVNFAKFLRTPFLQNTFFTEHLWAITSVKSLTIIWYIAIILVSACTWLSYGYQPVRDNLQLSHDYRKIKRTDKFCFIKKTLHCSSNLVGKQFLCLFCVRKNLQLKIFYLVLNVCCSTAPRHCSKVHPDLCGSRVQGV